MEPKNTDTKSNSTVWVSTATTNKHHGIQDCKSPEMTWELPVSKAAATILYMWSAVLYKGIFAYREENFMRRKPLNFLVQEANLPS